MLCFVSRIIFFVGKHSIHRAKMFPSVFCDSMVKNLPFMMDKLQSVFFFSISQKGTITKDNYVLYWFRGFEKYLRYHFFHLLSTSLSSLLELLVSELQTITENGKVRFLIFGEKEINNETPSALTFLIYLLSSFF